MSALWIAIILLAIAIILAGKIAVDALHEANRAHKRIDDFQNRLNKEMTGLLDSFNRQSDEINSDIYQRILKLEQWHMLESIPTEPLIISKKEMKREASRISANQVEAKARTRKAQNGKKK